MSDYKLYCFAQSGNAYRAALMLNLIGAKWEPVWVDFFGKKEQLTPEYRGSINEMGEIPVLLDGDKKFSQSAVILNYLADKTGQFRPENQEERYEALRWMVFDNQKVNGFLGPCRALKNFLPGDNSAAMAFLKGRLVNNLGVVNKRLDGREWLIAKRPTIADISMSAYLYYPAEEFGFDIAKEYPAIGKWLDRLRQLPNWGHPYDLMPGHPLPAKT